MGIPIVGLNDEQSKQLASTALSIKANSNPDQARDAHGRWTGEGSTPANELPQLAPEPSSQPSGPMPKPRNTSSAESQLAADNQRENKMVTDIVVQLRLSKDQRQELHRTISGQGLT